MSYGIVFRVSGDYALFTRPEMKVERVSYDVITPSAARGIIEAVYWKPSIRWVIDRIHVLNEIEFTNIRRNEVSVKIPKEKIQQAMKGKDTTLFLASNNVRQQRGAMVLKNVDYIIEAQFVMIPEKSGEDDTKEKHFNMVTRRLRKGQYHHAPCLGTREFGAKLELIENDQIPHSFYCGEKDLGRMLYDLDFSDPNDIKPLFFHAKMQDGVIDLKQVELRR
jgi:CRISPR-associated protein Cas5d